MFALWKIGLTRTSVVLADDLEQSERSDMKPQFHAKVYFVIFMPEEPVKILVVGHSWCHGTFTKEYELELENKLSKVLGKPVDIDVVAKIGSRVNWAQDRLNEKDLSGYSAVILFTGVNDAGLSEKVIFERFTRLYNTASGNGARKIFVFNIAPWDDHEGWIESFNKRISKGFPKEDIIDLFSLMEKSGHGAALHPSNAGYEKIRDMFEQKLVDWAKTRRELKSLVPELKDKPKEPKQTATVF